MPSNIDPKPQLGDSPKVVLWKMLRACVVLTEDQRLTVILIAHGETGATYRSTAHNDTASEVSASVKAWDHNPALAEKLLAQGHGGRVAWCNGSGGYGGRLQPYFGDDMLDMGMAADPALLFSRVPSLLSTLVTCWKLQQTGAWERSDHTVGALRIGFYGPGMMDEPLPTDRREKYVRHARDSGVGIGLVDRVLPTFPAPSIVAQLGPQLRALGY